MHYRYFLILLVATFATCFSYITSADDLKTGGLSSINHTHRDPHHCLRVNNLADTTEDEERALTLTSLKTALAKTVRVNAKLKQFGEKLSKVKPFKGKLIDFKKLKTLDGKSVDSNKLRAQLETKPDPVQVQALLQKDPDLRTSNISWERNLPSLLMQRSKALDPLH
ncbi:unnamed protein product [Phytophthora lilii]|uniref:Unnamed protein product n=1 Tax=Phytophthora lilii TaxID=2077276 RepID=A0A9W6TDT9_9STRA|nr:unnamed protein product [Phytophthora lilii]